MNAPASTSGQIVGIRPWLPWPLSAWPWWTDPVRAERLAALRIAVGACLLFDVAYNYAPDTLAYYGKDGLGEPAVFNHSFRAPKMAFSLVRGVNDEVSHYLALTTMILMTLWIVGTSLARLLLIHKNPPRNDRTGYALVIWTVAFLWYVLGLWSHMIETKAFAPPPGDPPKPEESLAFLAWVIPLLGFTTACLFHVLDVGTRLRDPDHRIPWVWLGAALVVAAALSGIGLLLSQMNNIDQLDPKTWWLALLRSWQDEDKFVVIMMAMWIGFSALLLLGIATRFSAVMAWLISISFGNLNSYLDNAGDTIRLILLFYVMVSPCGVVWSVDALLRRRAGPVYVYPWPIRLLFVQMIFIYFMNGMYKLFGPSWRDGYSLYYVLGYVELARYSQMSVPLSDENYVRMTRLMTWSVVVWEVLFPLLVIWKWPRRLALFMGVMFHLGIFATMELACFVPYALCMYVPLLPWEKLSRVRDPST